MVMLVIDETVAGLDPSLTTRRLAQDVGRRTKPYGNISLIGLSKYRVS